MTATMTASEIGLASDETATRRPGLARLTRVELRKSRDTRAGLWLLILIAAATVGIELIVLFTGDKSDLTFDNFFGVALVVQAMLIPVLGILLVTSEWSQRTALVTFALVPRRSRIVVAKLGAALCLAVASTIVALGVGALMTAIGGTDSRWDLSIGGFGEYGLLNIIAVVQGVAFGMLLLNSAAAIVAYFIIPTVWTILFDNWHALAKAKDWVDLNSAMSPVGDHHMTGADWGHLAVAVTIWIVIPLALGVRRLLRAELK